MWKMDSNQNRKRLIALSVVIVLFISMFCPVTARAEGLVEHTDIFVVSTETAVTAIWSTALYQDRIYVKMSDFSLACGVGLKRPENSGEDYQLTLDGLSVSLPADSVIIDGEEIWIPLEECLNKCYFSSLFLMEERTLILRRTGIDKLLVQMNAIYNNAAYKMSSWQNMKELFGLLDYENSYYSAVAVDVVTNFKFLNVTVDKYEQKQYESALSDIFLVEMDGKGNGVRVALEDSQKIFGTIAKGKKDTDNLFKVLFNQKESGFMGDLGAVSEAFTKAAKLLPVEEILMYNKYLEMVGGVNVSYKNALEYIVEANRSNDDCSRNFLAVSQNILDILNENEPAWKTYVAQQLETAFLEKFSDFARGEFSEWAAEDILAVNKAVIAIEKMLINLVFHTDAQVEGTIKAHCQLEIQNMCRYTYNKYLQQYKIAADDAEKMDCLLKMHDLTQFYLACGICAWKAVSIDAALSGAGSSVISEMQNLMTDLCAYTPECFKYYEFNREACEELAGTYYVEDITEDDLPGNSDLVKEILYFGNKGFLSSRIEYIYTEDGLVERKREYYATEDTYDVESMSLEQETVYTYDEKGRVSLEQIYDAEGKLFLTGTYSYDEEYGLLREADFRGNWGTAVIQYEFTYAVAGAPIISGEYIWNNFRNIYFNDHVKYVFFRFGSNGEIVECLAYSSGNFTNPPVYAIDYTCDENGAITSMTCQDVMNGWGSYSCEYERSSKGIETISYYYPSGENMRREGYHYDDRDRIYSIDVIDEETGEGYNIIYNYY